MLYIRVSMYLMLCFLLFLQTGDVVAAEVESAVLMMMLMTGVDGERG